MADKMRCSRCGRLFDSDDYQSLDNGNPACPVCIAEEREEERGEE